MDKGGGGMSCEGRTKTVDVSKMITSSPGDFVSVDVDLEAAVQDDAPALHLRK